MAYDEALQARLVATAVAQRVVAHMAITKRIRHVVN